jgi:type II secretory pathway component PulF
MSRIGISTLAKLLRRVGTSLHAGLDTRRIWEREADFGSPTHKQHLAIVRDRINQGDTLAEAFRACRGYFPPLCCDLIEVGETTGHVDRVLIGLAEHYEHLLTLRRSFLVSIAWPTIQLVAAIFIVGLLIWIMGIVNPTVKILGLSGTSGLLTYMMTILLFGGSIAILVIGTTKGSFGLAPVQLALRIPMLGDCLKTMSLANMAWSLGLALDAGIDAQHAMRLALRSTNNPLYLAQIDKVDAVLQQREEFSVALAKTGVFPDDFVQAMATGEIAGTHSDAMFRLAEDYKSRAISSSRILTMIAGFLIWGLVAGLIVMMIFQLASQVIFQPYREALDFLNESQR